LRLNGVSQNSAKFFRDFRNIGREMVKRARHVNGWSGRDVNQEHRVLTPLELFFDLTFAVSLAGVAEEMSHRGEDTNGKMI